MPRGSLDFIHTKPTASYVPSAHCLPISLRCGVLLVYRGLGTVGLSNWAASRLTSSLPGLSEWIDPGPFGGSKTFPPADRQPIRNSIHPSQAQPVTTRQPQFLQNQGTHGAKKAWPSKSFGTTAPWDVGRKTRGETAAAPGIGWAWSLRKGLFLRSSPYLPAHVVPAVGP